MTASLLYGKPIADSIKQDIKKTIQSWVDKGIRRPSLAVILMGEDPASEIYVRNKRQACEEVGIISRYYALATDTTESQLLDLINMLNKSAEIDGILVQLPLPRLVETQHIIEAIDPSKDVDGFHPYNIGRLAQNNPTLRSCTPHGIMQLLKAYTQPVEGKHAVIVGASNIVGRPMALELLSANATITLCHRFTTSLKKHVETADILIVATGVPDLIHPQWLHSEQIVLDVGIHRLSDGSLRGDLNFHAARSRVAWITPVPGGVGPMTIAALLQNTLQAYLLRL